MSSDDEALMQHLMSMLGSPEQMMSMLGGSAAGGLPPGFGGDLPPGFPRQPRSRGAPILPVFPSSESGPSWFPGAEAVWEPSADGDPLLAYMDSCPFLSKATSPGERILENTSKLIDIQVRG